MFAIVDIETTGLYAGANGITEIAIVLHNGVEIEGSYNTLINPRMPIQKYVQGLTGITDAMVQKAPLFSQVAPNIYNLLHNRIFVAHNVNFDYSFVKDHLAAAGYLLNAPKICTIRLAKKLFPGLPKYGLATLTKEWNIPLNGHHRALGDAQATALIFDLLLKNDRFGEIQKMLKKKPSSTSRPT
jgi:DNA polymerase III subunit epsilon